MTNINPYFFSDPFIRPTAPFQPSSPTTPSHSPVQPDLEPSIKPTPSPKENRPQITKDLWDLSNPKVIVYRSSPTSVCHGPAITVPVLNLEISSAQIEGGFTVNCVSTYPIQAPYSPIADRFDIRFFRDSFILTLTDGCGLHPSSRLAPKAAIEGFWNYLQPKLKEETGHFDVHKLGAYLNNALKAAHFNIYWDAYERSQEGFAALRQNVTQVLNKLDQNTSESASITEILNLRKEQLLEEIDLIKKALEGDLKTQKQLVEKNLPTQFYKDYAGATTFMSSALLKNASSSEFPFYLLTINLGDGQCFVLREGELMEMTQDTRKDLSNVRDPGGKMGLCTPTPLKMDERNLQYSLTPCKSKDLLLFMTDGVLDNLNPDRIGLHPTGFNTPYWIQEKIRDAGEFSGEEFEELLSILNVDHTSWKEVPTPLANEIKSKFVKKCLEVLVQNAPTSEIANEKVIRFCTKITEGHREKSDSYSFEEPLGKPDHTTCLSYQIP